MSGGDIVSLQLVRHFLVATTRTKRVIFSPTGKSKTNRTRSFNAEHSFLSIASSTRALGKEVSLMCPVQTVTDDYAAQRPVCFSILCSSGAFRGDQYLLILRSHLEFYLRSGHLTCYHIHSCVRGSKTDIGDADRVGAGRQ